MWKYWIYLKNQISLVTLYRVEMLSRWIMSVFEISVYIILWSLVTGKTGETNRLVLYYVLFYGILHNMQTGKVAGWMGNEILSGEINQYLLKPISYPVVLVMRAVTVMIVRIIVPVLIVIFGCLLLPSVFAPASIWAVLGFVFLVICSVWIWNLLMLILGTVAFRGTEIGSLNTTIDLILNLLKGAYIPAFLFPASVIAFLKLTPIYYLNAFPIDVYQGKVNLGEFIWGFLIICIWIISLSWIFGKLFKKGLLSYEAYGS